jgi:hypothetical protein
MRCFLMFLNLHSADKDLGLIRINSEYIMVYTPGNKPGTVYITLHDNESLIVLVDIAELDSCLGVRFVPATVDRFY